MVTVEVNANANVIEIRDAHVTIAFPVQQPHAIKGVLEELFNRVFTMDGRIDSVALVYIDEDTRYAVGEWEGQ